MSTCERGDSNGMVCSMGQNLCVPDLNVVISGYDSFPSVPQSTQSWNPEVVLDIIIIVPVFIIGYYISDPLFICYLLSNRSSSK